MTAVMDNKVLVLNSGWQPFNVVSVYDAMCSVLSERCKIIDPTTFMTYDFEEWVMNWEDASKFATEEVAKLIHTPRFAFMKPEIIVCTEYTGMGFARRLKEGKAKFCRRSIFIRDHDTCQYCGKKFPKELLNIDHVVPRCRGGKTEWTNVVVACIKCNDRKRDRMPCEAGMKLIRNPKVPTASQVRRPMGERLMKKIGRQVPQSWSHFLDGVVSDVYWMVELQK